MSNPLARHSLLLNLHISMWQGEVTDRAALAVVAKEFESDVSDDKYKKSLFVGDPLKKIKRSAGRLRLFFYRETLPWLDGGNGRLIPSRSFRDFSIKYHELKQEFYANVDEFLLAYEIYVKQAEKAKNRLFHAGEYPAKDNVRKRFAVTLGALPFPNSADFRIEAPEEVIRELEQSSKEALSRVTETLEVELRDRLREHLQSIHDALAVKSSFRSSTFETAIETTELASNLRDCLNTKFISLVDAMRQDILTLEPEEIRNSEDLRKAVIKECTRLLAII